MPTNDSWEVTDARPRNGWWWAENEVFDLKVSIYAKAIYCYLCRRADGARESWPSLDRIAADLDVSVPTVRRALSELQTAKAVDRRLGSGRGRVTIYKVCSLRERVSVVSGNYVSANVGSERVSVVSPDAPERVSDVSAKEDSVVKLNKTQEQDSRHRHLPDADFLASLKANPAYQGIDLDRELGKMDAWLSTPQGQRRTKTRRFIVGWLNRASDEHRPVDTGGQASALSRVGQQSMEGIGRFVNSLKRKTP